MVSHLNVVVTQPLKDPPDLVDSPSDNHGSVLGQIFPSLRDEKWVTPTFERVAPTQEKLFGFTFTVCNDIDPSSKKPVLELCWEMCERLQWLNRRIALYQYPEERIERSGTLHYFLIRVAGIVGGDVAASKAMAPHLDRRVRDYLAEDECPNYLATSFKDVILKETPARVQDKRWGGMFSSCKECEKEFESVRGFAFCGEDVDRQGDCKRAWLTKHPHCELPKPEPTFVDGVVAHSEGERQAKWTAPFARSRVSKAQRAFYEAKLFADVAAYRAKEQSQIEEGLQLKKSADLYWTFCVAFEFPEDCDQEAMEKAAEHLIKTVPREHLELFFNERKRKRHYVRHGASEMCD